VLHPFVRELAESERFRSFLEELPETRARVSEPALPLVVSALFEELGRALVVLAPEDADAHDIAEAAAWFLGDDRVALLPSRGVSWSSGLEPPPHLVGERARALDVLAAGGLVVASAAALAEALPPPGARPEPIRVRPGDDQGIDALAERLALAGYERVEQAQERGQFALRGGIVDVYPTTGREPLRIELFGDEVESIRAFSPFTQRTLHPVDEITIYPAAERRLDLDDVRLSTTRLRDRSRPTSCPRSRQARTSSGNRSTSARSGSRKSSPPST
jgi:transcription-repair coupling factor (superfamily II helicase)